MPFFKSRKSKNRRTDGTGFLTYSDAYQLIKENIDEAVEFYELEPAIVTQVLLNPSDFPRKDTPTGNGKMPDYSYLGTVRARFVESQDVGDEIDDYIKPLSPHMVAYPLIGEVVNIAKHGNQMYYYQPLNMRNHVNMNVANNVPTDPKVTAQTTEHNRNLLSEYGDVVVGANSDDWLIRKKGKFFMPFLERKEILESIKYIDSVLAFDDSDDSACQLIKDVKSHYGNDVELYFGNGGDRTNETTPEIEYCEKNNIGLMLKEGLLKENIDGEALRWTFNKMKKRKEERKILMVISDGAPVDDSTLSTNANDYLEIDLKNTVNAIEKLSSIELLAIGIGHDVTRYYNKAIKITDVHDLGDAMINQLTDLFSSKKIIH